MLLPLATIGLNLATLGLKAFGGDSKLLEVLGHPVDLLAGHLSAETAMKLAERLRKQFDSYQRIKNEDLDRAVALSALLADLFCLQDALPPASAGSVPHSKLREKYKTLLGGEPLQGIVSQAEESALRPAIQACGEQLDQLEKGDFKATQIDSQNLVLPERGGSWAAKLASDRYQEIAAQFPNIPDRTESIFKERWFPYLCLAFHDRLKSDQRVANIFQAVQSAEGFAEIMDVLREEVLPAIHALAQPDAYRTLYAADLTQHWKPRAMGPRASSRAGTGTSRGAPRP